MRSDETSRYEMREEGATQDKRREREGKRQKGERCVRDIGEKGRGEDTC